MKYQKELEVLPQCPPANAIGKDVFSYRFVYDPLGSSSFEPAGIKKPARVCRERNDEKKCSMMALSFFISEESSRAFIANMERVYKKFDKTKIGTHLASGDLTKARIQLRSAPLAKLGSLA